jgi:hypothetical protein
MTMPDGPRLALLLSRRAVIQEATSAYPDAPVIPPRPRPRRPGLARRILFRVLGRLRAPAAGR